MSEETPRRYSVKDILPYLGAHKILGSAADKYFSRLRVVTEADAESLVWISPSRADKQTLAEQTAAGIIVCDDSIQVTPALEQEKCFVLVPDPKWSFAKIANALFAPEIEFGVHPTAYVHAEAQIHERTYIGPFSYIGKSSIGEGTVISGHCHVYDNIQIGKRVRIHAGSVIGADGFGYLTGEDGRQVNFPHVGGVVIEDDVEIGANTCIDRGALGNTHLKEGAKIDNLVHIAHNVVVGKHAMVIAHALVGGSTTIGDGTWVAPSAVLRDGLVVGSHSTIGLGAVLTKDVPDNETWTGVPARPLSQFLDLQKKLKQL